MFYRGSRDSIQKRMARQLKIFVRKKKVNSYRELPNPRPVHRLADGRPAVTVEKKLLAIYELEPGKWAVDPSQPAESAAARTKWLDNTALPSGIAADPDGKPPELATRIPLNWYLETNHYGHYLVFDGSEAILDGVAHALKAAGFAIRRKADSYRPSDNGVQYDWFIRFDEDESSKTEMEGRIRDALSSQFDLDCGHGEAEVDFEQDDRTQLDVLIARLGEMQSALEKMEQDLEEPAESREPDERLLKLESRERKLRSDLEDNRQRNATLEEERAEASATQEGLEALVARLQTELRGKDEHIEVQQQLLEEANHRDDERATLRAEVGRVEAEKLAIEQQLAKSGSTGRSSPSTPRRKHLRTVAAALERFCTALRFDDEAVEVIAEEFVDLRGIFQALAILNGGGDIPKSEVRGQKDWWELDRHIGTGRKGDSNASMGRVYFRADPNSASNWFVVLHRKQDEKEQARFLESLPRRYF